MFFSYDKRKTACRYCTSSRSPTQNSTEAHCPRFLVVGHPKPIALGASLSYGGLGPYNSGGIISYWSTKTGPQPGDLGKS